ncbi:hypothetical protein ABIA30_004814 [Mycobacterium sp. MAA66]
MWPLTPFLTPGIMTVYRTQNPIIAQEAVMLSIVEFVSLRVTADEQQTFP